MALVNTYLGQAKIDNTFDEYLKKLTMEQSTLLLECVLKNLQLISEGNSAINAALMLKLHAKIIEKKGLGIQVRAISKRNPL